MHQMHRRSCRRLAAVSLALMALLFTLPAATLLSRAPAAMAATVTNINFTTTWVTPDFEDIPIWVAQEKGWYKQAGLDIHVLYPPSTTTAPKLLSTGNADLGYVETSDIVEAVQQGAPVRVIAGMWEQEANSLSGKPGTTINPHQFGGKTFSMFAGPANVAELNDVLRAAHVARSQVHVVIASSDDIALMLAGKVDYALNAAPYAIAEVESATGKKPALLMLSKLGLPQFLQTAYAGNTAWMAAHPAATRAFVSITLRAVEFARAHPAAAVALFMKATGTKGGSKLYSSAGWSGVIPLLEGPEGLFKMTNSQWINLEKFLVSGKAISGTLPSPSSLYTNQYIP